MITAASNSGGGAIAGLLIDVILSVVAFAAYWAPSYVAFQRKVPNTGSIVVVNLLLGWTVIGWVVALAMAFRDPRRGQPDS